MMNETNQLNCLYYPFSRLLDSVTLKYLLLVFDSVTFLDEVEDAEWRRILLQRMAQLDSPMFSSFEELADDYDMLAETASVRVLNPKPLKANKSVEVALATVADLNDRKFIDMASNPTTYGLPSRPLGLYRLSPADRPTWQVFPAKIAAPLLKNKKFLEDKRWTSHVLVTADESSSWTLSYEAGSAVVTNFYLEAAQELKLTPVTTSPLHHELVLRKLKRVFADEENKIDLIDTSERKRYQTVFGQGEIIRLLGGLYPTSQLDKVSFAEILKFRTETQKLRQKFVQEITETLREIDDNPTTARYDTKVIQAIRKLESDFRKHEDELAGIRDKILPAFGKAVMYGTAGGGALSALVSFLGGLTPAGVVAASALTISGALFVEAAELWKEKRKAQRGQSSSVSYLAKVSKLVGS